MSHFADKVRISATKSLSRDETTRVKFPRRCEGERERETRMSISIISTILESLLHPLTLSFPLSFYRLLPVPPLIPSPPSHSFSLMLALRLSLSRCAGKFGLRSTYTWQVVLRSSWIAGDSGSRKKEKERQRRGEGRRRKRKREKKTL